MLYVTTRNKIDTFTANHTLVSDRSRDGGLYVPFKLPAYSTDAIRAWMEKSFGSCVAEILNQCFSSKLDGWDVDFCIGKNPVRLVPMSHKLVMAETWHNTDWEFSSFTRSLVNRVRDSEGLTGEPSSWAKIAVRIAFLFGLFAEMNRCGIADAEQKVDVALSAGDFITPMAVIYAKQMGLPVGNLVCGCTEDETLWDLFRQGQIRIDPLNQKVCDGLERLICFALGQEEALRFASIRAEGGVYFVDEEQRNVLSRELYSAVVSKKRIQTVIRNVYHTNSYILHPEAAVAFGAAQDYRTAAGKMRPVLLLNESSPVCAAGTVSAALGIEESLLKQWMKSV